MISKRIQCYFPNCYYQRVTLNNIFPISISIFIRYRYFLDFDRISIIYRSSFQASIGAPFGASSQSASAKKSMCTVTGTGSTAATSDSRSSWLRGGGIYQLIQKMFQFMVKRSCTCAPMVMMVSPTMV